jgi:hypothetical protein
MLGQELIRALDEAISVSESYITVWVEELSEGKIIPVCYGCNKPIKDLKEHKECSGKVLTRIDNTSTL